MKTIIQPGTGMQFFAQTGDLGYALGIGYSDGYGSGQWRVAEMLRSDLTPMENVAALRLLADRIERHITERPEAPWLKYLNGIEWSAGNGQCPDCTGAHDGWIGHPSYPRAADVGHKADCPLATAIEASGRKPMRMGDCTQERSYEDYAGSTDRGAGRVWPLRT